MDIFLSETDYVFKYTDADADVAMPLEDLGIDPATDLADQYEFTKTTASDQNGVQRGSTWQCCPGLLVYRRDIAKDVFGTDDPVAVGEKVKDWDTLKGTAEELKAKGYLRLPPMRIPSDCMATASSAPGWLPVRLWSRWTPRS
ncbi:MAG: hypothetical protein ACLU9S_03835 [Oscillospiraceae bacterium]